MSEPFYGVVHLPSFLLGTLIIVLLPGPNSLYVLSTAARRGVRAGYSAACGVFIGDAVLMVLASAGVATLLATYPAAFAIFKYAGAAYLAWIGFKMLLGAWRGATATDATLPAAADVRDPLRRALGISLLNPKAILFFIAYFIQFVDRSYAAPALSFLILGLIVQTFSFLYLSTLIFGGVHLAAAFRRRQRLSAGISGAAGSMFLAFSVKLAMATLN